MSDNTLNELLNDAMNNVEAGLGQTIQNTAENIGDKGDNRWTGKVIDNDDPEKLGRIKILVFGYYDDLAESALPWAVPDLGYIGGSNGNFVIPEIGTIVRGYFDEKDIQKPIFDSVAFTQVAAQDTTKNPLMNKFEDYPHKMVLMETDQGEYLTLNKKNGEVEFNHRSGFNIIIDANGNMSIHTGSGLNPADSGRLNLNVMGAANIDVGGDATLRAKMNVNIDTVEGDILLGNNPIKRPCNNIDQCFVTGLRHNIGNTKVKC